MQKHSSKTSSKKTSTPKQLEPSPRTLFDAEAEAAKAHFARVDRTASKMERLLRNDEDRGNALEAVLIQLSNVTQVFIYDPSIAKLFYLVATLKTFTDPSKKSRADEALGAIETLLNPKTKRATVRAIEREYCGFNMVNQKGGKR